jgi:hypothetical protein
VFASSHRDKAAVARLAALNLESRVKSLYGLFGAALLIVACSDSTVAPGGGGGSGSELSNLGGMDVGDVRVLTASSASGGLSIPASLTNAQYAVIIGNVNVASGNVASYQVSGDWLAPSGVQAPSADVFAPTSSPLATTGTMSRGQDFEARLRNFERTRLPRPGGRRPAGSGVSASKLVPMVAGAVNPPPAVGSTLTLKVLTEAGFGGVSTDACSGYASSQGIVKYVSSHAIIVSDVNSPSGGFSNADFQAIGDEFDQLIYPTDVSYFGTPTDLDNNGHIIIYYTPAVNKLTPAGQAETSGYVGGFFFAGDLYPPSGQQSCASSNQGEIFYLLAPDPSGANGNTFSTSFVRQVTRGTVAHEFQHMINSGNRYISPNVENFETTWLDEGLAHFAEDAVGRVKAGFGDNYAVSYTDITSLDTTVTQAFFIQNLARAKFYVERPDTTGAIVSRARASANLASRGAEWALVRYVADWFNTGGDPRTLTRKLVAGPDTGTVNMVAATGASMDTILAHFTVALYADHRAYLPSGSPYNFKSYNFRQLVTGILLGSESTTSYLPVGTIGSGTTSVIAKVPASSGAYFLTASAGSAARTIKLTDATGSASTDPNARIYVVRVQ